MKGQSTIEYAVLIIIIMAALMTIQVYIKRGVQGRLRSATDDIGDQFSPGNTNYSMSTKTFSKTEDTFLSGATTSNLIAVETTNMTSNTSIINVDQEFWGLSP